ncbi:DUF3810 domain-containing protein [Myroides sp. LJL119]
MRSLKNKLLLSFILFCITWIITSYAQNNPSNIQYYYTDKFYTTYSTYFIFLAECFPFSFSLGDTIYLILVIAILFGCFLLIRSKKTIKQKIYVFFANSILVLTTFWFVFNITWGLNNYNKPLEQTLGISLGYDNQQVVELSKTLVSQTIQLHKELSFHKNSIVSTNYSYQKILKDASLSISKTALQTHSFTPRSTIVKPSVFSNLLTYMGFSGYVNPFTTEAQVNKNIPKLTMIVTASHELAHQLGFAKESEANFIGYLNAKNQNNLRYQYAANIFALRYCLSELKKSESTEFLEILESIPSGILYNIQENTRFWLSYKNFADSLMHIFYDSFLKVNNQKQGIQSYNRFIDLLINYHIKPQT